MPERTYGNIRQLKSKRWQWRFPHPVTGVETSAPSTFLSRGDAEYYRDTQEREISRGIWVDPAEEKAKAEAAEPTGTTLGEWAKEWLVLSRHLTPRTRGGYRGLIEGDRFKDLRDIRLVDLDASTIQHWIARMPSKTATRNGHAVSLLSTLLNDAVDERKIAVSPYKSTRRATRAATKEKRSQEARLRTVTIMTDLEIATLAERMDGRAFHPRYKNQGGISKRYRALVYVSAYCCLRFGELAELRCGDYFDGSLHIRRAVTWVEPEDLPEDQRPTSPVPGPRGSIKRVPVVGEPKASSQREVPVPRFLQPILEEHLRDYAEEGDDGLIFPAKGGGRMTHNALYKVFTRARADMQRKDFTWHQLRHTGAVSWALGDGKSGATTYELMALLGHTTPEMAMHYQHVASDRLKELGDRVSKRVIGKWVDKEIEMALPEGLADAA